MKKHPTSVKPKSLLNNVEYILWRWYAWLDNQGSYNEIEEKVARGELVPEWPYQAHQMENK